MIGVVVELKGMLFEFEVGEDEIICELVNEYYGKIVVVKGNLKMV